MFPEAAFALALLGVAFGLCGLPILRNPVRGARGRCDPIAPHPSQPGSMLSFVGLSSFLLLMSLARFGVFVSPQWGVNSPDSWERQAYVPAEVNLRFVGDRVGYPTNTAELAAEANGRLRSGSPSERRRAIRDVAWWTAVCPTYSPFTLPGLTSALRDPDPAVLGAAVVALGSLGGHGSPAVPDLLAARGTSVRHLDHVISEALHSIRTGERWAPATECEPYRAVRVSVAPHNNAMNLTNRGVPGMKERRPSGEPVHG